MTFDLATTEFKLTEQEQIFIYQLEFIGLPVKRAAEVAGIASPNYVLRKPHVIAARDQARLVMRNRTNWTREDVIAGLADAIDQAKILGDSMAQIAGLREIAKLLGYDKTPNVHLHLTGTIEQQRKQIEGLPIDELVKLAGSDALDGDFYQVNADA